MGPLHTSPHLLHHLTFSYIFPYLPHIRTHFLHLPLIPLPTSPLPRPTPQHIFLLSPHLPSPSQSVAQLPCDEVSVAKLPCGEVTGNCFCPLQYLVGPPAILLPHQDGGIPFNLLSAFPNGTTRQQVNLSACAPHADTLP